MEPLDTTQGAQGDGSQLNPAPAIGASSTVAPAAMTLEQLNATLGKQFKDIPTALASLAELNSFVGKRKEDFLAEAGIGNEKFAQELKELKENQFYTQNPELKDYRSLISKLGSNPEEVIASAEFQQIFSKAKGYDETVKLKTVLESNSRLSASKDHLSKAKESMEAGKTAEAEVNALNAVKEAYEL